MQAETFTYQSEDKQAEIFTFKWSPDEGSAKRGIVLLVHGMAEHAARYARLAERMTQDGFVVYAHDQRGHGKTARQPEDIGYFADDNGWLRVIQDIITLHDIAHKADPSLPIVLFGHSMGSFLVQFTLFEHSKKFAGAVLSAAVDTVGPLRLIGIAATHAERYRLGRRGRSKLLNAMSFGDFNKPFRPNRTDFDWLSRDAAEVDAYVADDKCGFIITTQMWLDCLHGFGEIARSDLRARVRHDLPVYLVGGEKDPVTRMGEGMKGLAQAYTRAGLTDLSLHLYPDGRHEIFNETNRKQVMEDLMHWLLRITE
ncbi:MAG: lysophospholipase [Myxococcales bacterium]|nr:lysophospholipase [Myxococcales bacterium]